MTWDLEVTGRTLAFTLSETKSLHEISREGTGVIIFYQDYSGCSVEGKLKKGESRGGETS